MPRQAEVPEALTHGPFALEQAEKAGLTRSQLRSACWKRIGRGIYMWAGIPDSPTLLLFGIRHRLPPGAAFSGPTAAWLHGLDLRPGDPVEVTVDRACKVATRAGMSLRHAILADGDVVKRHGLPVTSAIRTAFDLSRNLPMVEAVVALDMALHARLVDAEEVRRYISGHPRFARIAQARHVVGLANRAAESPMETRLRMCLVLAGLPCPDVQVPLHDGLGQFLGRPDLYYPDHRVAIEYDGGTHRDSLVADNRRQNRLLSAGFQLLRFTASDVYNNPNTIVVHVRAALDRTHSGRRCISRQ